MDKGICVVVVYGDVEVDVVGFVGKVYGKGLFEDFNVLFKLYIFFIGKGG